MFIRNVIPKVDLLGMLIRESKDETVSQTLGIRTQENGGREWTLVKKAGRVCHLTLKYPFNHF